MYLTVAQMRKAEERAEKELGISSLILMETAAYGAAQKIIALEPKPKKIVVFTGNGGNGGDGYACARHLFVAGYNICVKPVFEVKNKGDALINKEIAKKMGLISEENIIKLANEADIIIDAVLGLGFNGKILSEVLEYINIINEAPAIKIALDGPTGVDLDTGLASEAVKADLTLAFGAKKVGHVLLPGSEFCGKIEIINISIPNNFFTPYLEELTEPEIAPRPIRSHKGTFGRVTAFAGSKKMPGAAVLLCRAAYKSGAGLVCAPVVPDVARAIHNHLPEAIATQVLEKDGSYFDVYSAQTEIDKSDAIAIGPGIGRLSDTMKFAADVIQYTVSKKKPIVIDADALYALPNKINANAIITPHPGEMSTLCGLSVQEILKDPVSIASNFAKKRGLVVVLKDARSIISSPDGRNFVNTTGTAALAKAGSGDVLTGVIAALLAQGYSALDAAVLGAYLHGKAGSKADLNERGVTASDLCEALGFKD